MTWLLLLPPMLLLALLILLVRTHRAIMREQHDCILDLERDIGRKNDRICELEQAKARILKEFIGLCDQARASRQFIGNGQ